MATALGIFEDQYQNFLPLDYFRPMFDLRFGTATLREKIIRLFPGASVILHVRDYLEAILKEENPGATFGQIKADQIVFINGRALLDKKAAGVVAAAKPGTAFYDGDFLAAAVLSKKTLSSLSGKLLAVVLPQLAKNKKQLKVRKINFLWDLIAQNSAEIENDFKNYYAPHQSHKSQKSQKPPAGVKIFNRSAVFLGKNLKINPAVVIDGRSGPVIIEDGVQIGAFTVIEGPVFIGRGTIIKPNSYIYDGTSIGPFSKVAGEIEATIIQGYSNKQHAGFLGHSLIGEWVNLGAGTATSDLKNNYSTVKVILNGQKIDTGLKFLGALVGDHTKTAINTSLTTGTVCGIFANVFETPSPKNIPSFAWGGVSGKKFQLAKAQALAAIVMKRRGLQLTPAQKKLIAHLYSVAAD